ncbi:PREDICTED: trimethyllysine dioxygenase, mitochondrial isoform X1 [Rhagoletis zephyria]|uniref:trimethyllysine dioxygenase, mitochondrial isoform X1 n=2 Tax=Rhagoletis zephyria TaxID=28612 RepID=UPI0008117F9A|nr:PREDICTED: trimethyllysine dioxygenase, mitochondrial isoform X1 [Rhagoletis zephyria]
MIQIKHKSSGKILKINTFWLRDHCRCGDCYNVETKQRRYNLLDIPKTVKPLRAEYIKDELQYEVHWSDGHTSVYDIDFLYDAQVEHMVIRVQESTVRTPWNQSLIKAHETHLRTTLAELVSSEVIVRKIVQSLIRYGIAFIDDVPPNTTMTEMAVRRLFPPMKTFFGEMYTFSDVQDHADTAYTKQYLGLHTDNTYFCDAAGLQSLHCIRHVNGAGGENFFADGLYAALELKHCNPRAFEILTRVSVPAEYIEEGQYHKHSAPIIRVDPVSGEIVQLRLNVYDRAVFDSIPQAQMQDFYESFRVYLEIVQRIENQWSFKLNPGTVVIFDNWRVYHGRHAYTGSRTMTGCYVQRTDFLSKARILGIID